jgi:hypothetical protein
MKTDRQIGRGRPQSGKPAVGSPRAPRGVSGPLSAPVPPALANHHLLLVGLHQIRRSVPLATQFQRPAPNGRLIASLELEFSSSQRKHCPLRISNRKFSRVFRSSFSNLGITSSGRSDSEPSNSTLLPVRSSPGCQPLAASFLIHGSVIKNRDNPQGFNDVQFSNRR